jgi:hypothetical protein
MRLAGGRSGIGGCEAGSWPDECASERNLGAAGASIRDESRLDGQAVAMLGQFGSPSWAGRSINSIN